MLCQLRLLLVCFLKVLTVTTVLASDVADKMEMEMEMEKTRFENFKNDKFCESKSSWMTRNVMKVTSTLSLECRSKEQIKWIFSNPIKFKHDYRIESQWKKCGSNVTNMTDDYYFTSTINLNTSLYAVDLSEREILISCGHYRSLANESDTLPTILLKTNPKHNLQLTGNVEYKSIKSNWTSPCDDVILDIYTPNNTCLCRRGQNSFFKPQFLSCNNLVECEHLTSRKYEYPSKTCPGAFFNYCNSTSFDTELQGSGFIVCTKAAGGLVPYVPFMSLEYGSDLKGIRILTNDFSTYSQFLKISSLSGHSQFSRKDKINLQCSGPKFIFLKDFRWSLQSGNSTFDSFLQTHLTLTATTLGENSLIVSILTLTAAEHIHDVNVSIICEAALVHTNETVQSEPFSFKLLVPPPKVNRTIVCLNNKIVLYKCNINDELGVNLTWHSNKSNLVLQGCSLKPEFKDSCLLDDKCPEDSIICTAFRDGVETSKYFTQKNCQDFVRSNCTSNNKVIYTNIEDSQNATQFVLQTGVNDQADYGIYIGVAVGSCLLVFVPLMIFLIWKNRRDSSLTRFSDDDVENFMRGEETSSSKPELSALFLPYNTALEIPIDKFKLDPTDLLGAGAFGCVTKGKVGQTPVAIKTVKKSAEIPYFKALLSELKIMSYIGKHENIVELVGACTVNIKKKEVFVIFEFCSNGNVLEFIRSRRNAFDNQLEGDQFIVDQSKIQIPSTNGLCSENLIRWSFEVASGMDFVASLNVYHGDLAARNILLSENLVAKIGDFGLSKQLFQYSVYVQKLGCPLPLRWLSIESLRDLEFSIQSDVWSYGITLWEMFSLGSTPYPGLDWNFQAWKLLNDGHRMEKPDFASTAIYEIMMKCWNANLNERPTFGQLKEMFKQELDNLVRV